MKYEDFLNLRDFSPADVIATGATIESVQADTLYCLQNYATACARVIKLIKNGLTTGSHNAKEHPDGKAVDFYHSPDVSRADILGVVFKMICAGFNGIGIYFNGTIYSFHGDLRDKPTIWTGTKEKVGDPWKYNNIQLDPMYFHS